MTTPEPFIYDKTVNFIEDTAGLVIQHSQEIPDDFISDLKRNKIDTMHTPAGDLYRVASVPVNLAEEWKRDEGFDVWKEPARAIIARLKKHDMDAFITTNKRI